MEKTAKPETEELLACPECKGMGWQKQWPGEYREPPPDCRECDGTGERTKEQIEAYNERQRP